MVNDIDIFQISTLKIGNKKYIAEVKPLRQTKEPKTQKRNTKKYISEVMTYAVNQAKFKAADRVL